MGNFDSKFCRNLTRIKHTYNNSKSAQVKSAQVKVDSSIRYLQDQNLVQSKLDLASPNGTILNYSDLYLKKLIR